MKIPPKRLRKHPCNGVSGAFFNRCKAEIYGYYCCCFRVPSGRPACLAGRQAGRSPGGTVRPSAWRCLTLSGALTGNTGHNSCSTPLRSLPCPGKAACYAVFMPRAPNPASDIPNRSIPTPTQWPSSRDGFRRHPGPEQPIAPAPYPNLFDAQRASCSSIASVMERASRAIARLFWLDSAIHGGTRYRYRGEDGFLAQKSTNLPMKPLQARGDAGSV